MRNPSVSEESRHLFPRCDGLEEAPLYKASSFILVEGEEVAPAGWVRSVASFSSPV